MFGGFDPVAAGFVTSLARPEGNITGILILPGDSLAGKKLELLKEAVPQAARIALLAPADDPRFRPAAQEAQKAALALGIKLVVVEVRGGDYSRAFATIAAERAAALLIGATPSFARDGKRITELAASHRLPAMYEWPEQVEDGGLMSYDSTQNALFRRVAAYLDRIFKGTKPGDLPVEQPTTFELVINRASREADVFSGSQSRRGKSQSPVTRVAGWRETKTLKPTDQAIGRMVSESPGRNASERIGGPERLKPRRPSLTVERRRQHGPSHLAEAAGHSGGVRATAR
jgi:putative ABC transport system substrate-binding protein